MPVINVIQDIKPEKKSEGGRVRPAKPMPTQFFLTEEAIETVRNISDKECERVKLAAANLIKEMESTANFKNESKILKEVIMEQMIPSIHILSDFDYTPREQVEEYRCARTNMLLNVREMYKVKGIEPRYD